MEFFRKKFGKMELASKANFDTTLHLALDMIENTTVYNFVTFDSPEEMFSIHESNIFNPTRENAKKIRLSEYDNFRRKLVNFSCLVNDPIPFLMFYTPLMIANPLPVNREFILQFIDYNRSCKTKVLTYNGSPCTNNGTPVMCIESWRSFENLEALQRMYNNYSQCYHHLSMLPYRSACKVCTINVADGFMEPCQTCKALRFSYPNVTTVGNIFCLKTFTDELGRIKNKMKDTYKRRSCIGLQPSELRTIRTYLLSDIGKAKHKAEYDFQLWVMILLSVTLFLRFDEICNMKVSDFENNMFTLTESRIDNLSIWIKGKCDIRRNLFALRANKEYFDLNILPALMLYINKMNINDDTYYLFPGIRGGQFCAKSFDREVKDLLQTVLHKTANTKNIFGTHVWRKTAYAIALVGKLYNICNYIFYFTVKFLF